jgi:hypothetical protein
MAAINPFPWRKERRSLPAAPKLDTAKLMSVGRLRQEAKGHGRKSGRLAARYSPERTTIEDLPGRRLIGEECSRRIAATRQRSHERAVMLQATVEGSRLRTQAAGKRHEAIRAEVKSEEAAVVAAPKSSGVATIAYFACLLGIALAEYPTVRVAVDIFPADYWTRVLLAVILSAVGAALAHTLSHFLHRAKEAWPTRREKRADFTVDAVIAGGVGVLLIGALVGMAFARSSGLIAAEELSRGTFADGETMAWVLLAIQLALVGMAAGFGYVQSEGSERRKALRRLEKARKKEEKANEQYIRAQETQAQIEQEIAGLADEESRALAQEATLKETLVHEHDAAYEHSEHSLIAQTVGRFLGRQDVGV